MFFIGSELGHKAFFMLFVLSNLYFFPLYALKCNNFEADSAQKRQKNFRLLAASSAAVYTGSFIFLDKLWYQNGKNNFHFFNDNNNWQQTDKIGHAFSANLLSRYGYFLMTGAGISQKRAACFSAFSGGLLLTPIEFFDGFSPDYGASYGDLAANFSGSLFFGVQMFFWGEEKMRLKISYSESSFAAKRPSLFGKNIGEKILKDYNGQTYWLSLDGEKLLNSKRIFFKFCHLSFGYGGRNMLYANPTESASFGYIHERSFFLSLDFALNKLKTKKKWLKTIFEMLSVVKIPAPTLEFSRGKIRGHWVYF
jgi:uncharacterized protein YfiM (DUF2279 family)